MITVKIQVEQYVAEYIRGKYFDPEVGAVRFPSKLDIYILVYDLLQKRPVNCPLESGNLEFALPDRREYGRRQIAGAVQLSVGASCKTPRRQNAPYDVGRAARPYGRKQALKGYSVQRFGFSVSMPLRNRINHRRCPAEELPTLEG